MISRRGFVLGAMAGSALAGRVRADPAPQDEVLDILRERVDRTHQSVGIVAASFNADHEKIVTYGHSGSAVDRLDGDTVFEIGSITKTFTSLLLAQMVTQGEVKLDDPVSDYLTGKAKMPSRNGKQITFLDLATHTSGLPRLPSGIPASDENPYSTYSVEQLYEFLSNYTLLFDPGTHYDYSNLGFGLLGHVLALRAGRSFEDLLLSRVCEPLGLHDTRILLNSSMRERLAQGHLSNLKPASNWDLPTLAGAGALRSTANDLIKFVKATCLSGDDAPLRPAIDMLVQTRRPTSLPNTEVGLGVFIRTGNNDEIIYKEGETGGYASFGGFSTKLRSGAVVLSNATNLVNDIGFRLTNPAYKLAQYPPEVSVDAAMLATYQGVYQMSPRFALTIRAEGGRLFVRGTGQPEFELFAESEDRFFMRFVDAQGMFLHGKDGAIDRLLWHQNGRYTYCPRIS